MRLHRFRRGLEQRYRYSQQANRRVSKKTFQADARIRVPRGCPTAQRLAGKTKMRLIALRRALIGVGTLTLIGCARAPSGARVPI